MAEARCSSSCSLLSFFPTYRLFTIRHLITFLIIIILNIENVPVVGLRSHLILSYLTPICGQQDPVD